MNSSRLLRAIVTGLTLLVSLWFLHHLTPRHAPKHEQSRTAQVHPAAAVNPGEMSNPQLSQPPVEIQTLPLAALDNTCLDGVPTNLASATGMLSGAPARQYHLLVAANVPLQIELKPLYAYFDAAWALFDEQGRTVLGRDEAGPGWAESATVTGLAGGVYRLIVGGYSSDCGPYELTVKAEPESSAQIAKSSLHRGPNGTVVRWRSFAEVDLNHFRLIRLSDGQREPIAVLRAHGSPAGFADYRVIDRGARGDTTYELEAVSRDGHSTVVAVAS
jgi:hypothetical protein